MEIKDGRYFIPTPLSPNTHKMAAQAAPTDHIENLFKTITAAGSSTK
jgi:hypothetical protein